MEYTEILLSEAEDDSNRERCSCGAIRESRQVSYSRNSIDTATKPYEFAS